MEIDHIFIFSNDNGQESNELVELGFTEGSNRVHLGQGTVNRKFYFENFYLEILWVNNEKEITSELTADTKLWERSNYKINRISPFGLCLKNTSDIDPLFSTCQKYYPKYLPKGMSIDIITNEAKPYLPWTFRLPHWGEKGPKTIKPINHKNGIKKLTKVSFGVNTPDFKDSFTDFFKKDNKVIFDVHNQCQMTLEFDNHRYGKSINISNLNLKIDY